MVLQYYKDTRARTQKNPDETYSTCVRAGDLLFLSHHGGSKREDDTIVESIEEQTELTLLNLKRTLVAAGSDLDQVVQVNVLLRNKEDFRKMREVYRNFFKENYPARTAIFTDFLDSYCLIQINAIAYSRSVP